MNLEEDNLRTSINLQKRRSSLALSIRITIFLGVVIFYCILRPHFFANTEESYATSSGRKLLGFIPQSKSNKEKSTKETLKLTSSNDENKTITSTESMNKTDQNIEFVPLIKVINNIPTKVYNFSSIDNNKIQFRDDEWEFLPLDYINCTTPTINEFPPDGFTREQRKNGWIIIHILLACYSFWLLAAVCDDYFVPAIDLMCSNIKMDADVVGATFMAAAVSSPELFINCIGTFITKTDLGIGTIVGSAIFNILAVPACCGFFTGQMENLDWWPISRDCLMYCFAILCLIGTLYDGIVMWYEGLLLVIIYFIYIAAMFLNDQMACKARKLVAKFKFRGSTMCLYREVKEITPLIRNELSPFHCYFGDIVPGMIKSVNSYESLDSDYKSYESENLAENPWKLEDRGLLSFVIRWPITFLLWITTPDCKKHPNLKYITFIVTTCWLAVTSYSVSFFITYVGDTLNIPDSIMGLTILAAGMSIPEAVSSVLVTNQGYGSMGISNSIGSNIFGILIGLGLPWFIKSSFLPSNPNEYWILLSSSGLTYSAAALLATLFGFYISFLVNKFYLNWKIGISCTIMYIGFLILATMLGLNFFSNITLPVCGH